MHTCKKLNEHHKMGYGWKFLVGVGVFLVVYMVFKNVYAKHCFRFKITTLNSWTRRAFTFETLMRCSFLWVSFVIHIHFVCVFSLSISHRRWMLLLVLLLRFLFSFVYRIASYKLFILPHQLKWNQMRAHRR